MSTDSSSWPRGSLSTGLALLFVVLVSGCGSESGPNRQAPGDEDSVRLVSVSRGWLAMGTFFEADLRIPDTLRPEADAWLDFAQAEIRRLEKIYSRHDPDSELSRLNRALSGPAGSTVEVSPELAQILDLGFRLHADTRGRFDPSIGPLIELWWAANRTQETPPPGTIREAITRVGLSAIAREPGNRVRIRRTGATIDLDGLSKGVVLDSLRQDLERRFPHTPALLSLGQSSVIAIGSPSPQASGWRLELRSRGENSRSLGQVVLRDRAISISSSLGSVIEIAGQAHSHVIDPVSGWPVRVRAEASVVGRSAAMTDAWSTALLVMKSPSPDLAEAEALGLQVRIDLEDGKSFETSGWEAETQVH